MMASFETINASTNVRSETLSFTDEQGANIIVPHSLFEDLIQPPELNLQSLIRELEDTKKAESRYLWHSINPFRILESEAHSAWITHQ